MKRKKVSPVSSLAYLKSPSPVHVSLSAPAKEPATGACHGELQNFCNNLQLCLRIRSDDLVEARKEKRTAVGDCRSLHQQYEDLQIIITDQCFLHEQLVSDLKQRLQEVEDLHKTDLAYVESLKAGATATMEHLLVPQDVDKIPYYLQCITNCALKKGTHLP
jgi:hypothetical protein